MVTDRRILRFSSVVLGLGLLAVLGWHYSVTDFLVTIPWNDRHWTVVGLGLLGLYLVRPFLLWPLSVFSVLIGYLFGFPSGVPVVLLGTVLTCLPPFVIAARFDGTPGYIGRIADYGSTLVATTGELRGVIAARLSPAPADAVSYGAGMSGVSTRMFAIGTLIGELPWAVFYVFLGQSLRTFSATEIPPVDVRLILLGATVALLLVARPAYDFLRKRVIPRDEPSV